eukprot:s1277_g11.t1
MVGGRFARSIGVVRCPLKEPPLQERSGHFQEDCFFIACGAPVVGTDARSEDAPLQAPGSSGPSGSESAIAAVLPAPEPPVELPLHSTGDLEDAEEMLFIVTARTIHKAIECTDLERPECMLGAQLLLSFTVRASCSSCAYYFPENFEAMDEWQLWGSAVEYDGWLNFTRDEWFEYWSSFRSTRAAPASEPSPASTFSFAPDGACDDGATTLPSTGDGYEAAGDTAIETDALREDAD